MRLSFTFHSRDMYLAAVATASDIFPYYASSEYASEADDAARKAAGMWAMGDHFPTMRAMTEDMARNFDDMAAIKRLSAALAYDNRRHAQFDHDYDEKCAEYDMPVLVTLMAH